MKVGICSPIWAIIKIVTLQTPSKTSSHPKWKLSINKTTMTKTTNMKFIMLQSNFHLSGTSLRPIKRRSTKNSGPQSSKNTLKSVNDQGPSKVFATLKLFNHLLRATTKIYRLIFNLMMAIKNLKMILKTLMALNLLSWNPEKFRSSWRVKFPHRSRMLTRAFWTPKQVKVNKISQKLESFPKKIVFQKAAVECLTFCIPKISKK